MLMQIYAKLFIIFIYPREYLTKSLINDKKGAVSFTSHNKYNSK